MDASVPHVPMVAYVKCGGGASASRFLYNYHGIADCAAIMQLAAGGSKSCAYGCLGGRSCLLVCMFGAISIVDGIATVNEKKCTGCTLCVKACPKQLVEMVPQDKQTRVACFANDNAKTVRANCTVGCIACKLCVKACEEDAIIVENNLAYIDYEKCTQCGACTAKCPMKCICG